MELGVAITLMVGLSFLAVIGAKVAKNYFKTETERVTQDRVLKENQIISELTQKLQASQNLQRQTKYKLNKAREGYDLDFDEDEIDIDETNPEEPLNISELVKIVYPKLPPAAAQLIDKPELQEAIIKTAEKRPDLITNFIDKYLNKTPDQGNSQGSTSNTPSFTYN